MQQKKRVFRVLGLMSGSSLDGLDVALCRFETEETSAHLSWEMEQATTVPFSEMWRERLYFLPQQDALIFAKTHVYFGRYLSELIQPFLSKLSIAPDLIAAHGHTVFHHPDARYTVQIGDGAALSVLSGIPVVCDFRSPDVALDGEGAPVVPIVERDLFPEYDFFLNIGGIANMSFRSPEGMVAFDICAANQALNYLAQAMGQPFDEEGQLASRGIVVPDLLDQLNDLPYFRKPFPKSLSNQWVQERIFSILQQHPSGVADKMRTMVEHIAYQVVQHAHLFLEASVRTKMLVTGGGAFNVFLIGVLSQQLSDKGIQLEVPSVQVVEFKEALLMAYMGYLRYQGQINCLSSATGAQRDTIGGCIYLP